MNISFIIITNGRKPEKILSQIESIHNQKIKNYEIIVCGNKQTINLPKKNLIYVEKKDAAEKGDLGSMRNAACAQASLNNLVISDDDIYFSNSWYFNLCQTKYSFDILTPRVFLPDGTRFWDKCCYQSPKYGHVMLEDDEEDDYLYMSGGTGWVMKSYVYDTIKWKESLQLYSMNNLKDYAKGKHNEDTDFAQQCRHAGFKIFHNSKVSVLHDDPSYTAVGRLVRRRMHQSHNWCKELDFPPKIILEFSKMLWNYGIEAEAVDLLRYSIKKGDISSKILLDEMENSRGKRLRESEFNPEKLFK